MSYQVLARKWRPATFEQVVGQSHVLHALTNALTQNRLHHAYLFTGTRGVGKTSLARLFAKGLNCEQGITASPCGQCASCVEIAQGRFVDLIEVDAASRTKVDDTRELLDNVQYRPSRGRFKVYLIDEVHMLSRSSFNALLKTLEEPPEHVKFLLATTDPQRLPVTVLSRCLQFNLKSLTLDEICLQLGHILGQEQVAYDDGAVKLLAKAANGSMRDALSLTDQAIAFGAGQVQLGQVQTMLGTIDEHHVIVLLKALCDGDVDNLLNVTAEVLSYGADPFEVLRSLLELLHQITLTQFAPSAAQLSQYAEQIKAFAKQLRPEQVQLYYQLLLSGRKDLPHAPDPKSGLEMALLRAVAFVPEAPVQRWQNDAGSEILLPEVNTKAADKPNQAAPAASVPKQAAVGGIDSEKKTDAESLSPATVSPATSAPNTTLELTSELTPEQASEPAPESDVIPAPDVMPVADGESAHESIDDEEQTQALFAEQNLILSQAQSQGIALEREAKSKAQEAEEQAAIKPEVSDVDPVSSQSAPIASDVNASAMPEEMATSFEPDFFIDSDDEDASDPSDYEAYLAYQQGEVSAAKTPAEHQVQSQAGAHSPESGQSQGERQQPQAEKAASSEPSVLEDDLLDAVLNARQHLLSDLEAEAEADLAKESASKKPLLGSKSQAGAQPYVPPKRPSQADASTDNASDDNAQGDDHLLGDVEGQVDAQARNNALAQSEVNAQTSASNAADMAQARAQGSDASVQDAQVKDEDRPPWESPAQPSHTANELSDSHTGPHSDSHTGLHIDKNAPSIKPSPELSAEAPTAVENETAAEPHNTATSATASSSLRATASPHLSATASPHLSATVQGEIQGHDTDLKWYRLMSALDIGGRVRQLAVNAVCLQFSEPLPLVLKPNQKHLAAPGAIAQLEEALAKALGDSCQIEFSVGVEANRETPLEIRQRFHQELLQQAQQGLLQDENIQWLTQMMQAELDPDSLSYLPELLGKRGQTIALVNKSNFVSSDES
ncbi:MULTISPECIES: DNA polymerase III subunit gamma/tau [Shewanella]|uniref:DNA-directed DNA polymerase n=1 Tax=Shewanella marisflavi TaxID=260364 RepID=A0ABX5WKQ5_9GAMM|nr:MULTISPECIES: DNA polymerase III subunit gamma/tau [Shewanella]QDF75075.1 DNA polymerase III subunit gamma/tau [Shewanella marisflavi]